MQRLKSIMGGLVVLCSLATIAGCSTKTNSNGSPVNMLADLSGKTVTLPETPDNSGIVNFIEPAERLSFGKDKVHIKSVSQNQPEEQQRGADFYYLAISKAELLKYLPKDDRLNDQQTSINGAADTRKKINQYLRSIKEEKTQQYIILAPDKYSSIQEFEKEAPKNVFGTHGNYSIWEVTKEGHNIYLTTPIALQQLKQIAKEKHVDYRKYLSYARIKINTQND